MTCRVGILLFDDVEVLDFAGPFEVFSVASRLVERTGASAAFEVVTVGAGSPVRARHGLIVTPGYRMGEEPPIDVLVIPGGVVSGALADARTIEWIASRAAIAGLTTSVCTGAFLLAEAGLLDGRPATTHWEDLDDLAAAYPHVLVRREVPWVDDGDIVTSAGISAGIEMSLHVVACLHGAELASATARQMDYSAGEFGTATRTSR
ncbi:MAG: DJ-1/PfpI family protein [Chloroflexota bacterium]